MLKRRSLTERGDTIVEVLIVIAIMSLILTGAFLTTNTSNHAIGDSQEHSQALQLVQGQIEFLKAAGTSGLTGNDCFDSAGNPATGTACTITPNGSGTQPAYVLTLAPSSEPGASGTYVATASWDSLLGGRASVSLEYKP